MDFAVLRKRSITAWLILKLRFKTTKNKGLMGPSEK